MFVRTAAIILASIVLLAANGSWGDNAEDIERRVKAALVYQFTKYIEWPAKKGDFIIDVIEDDDLLKVIFDTTLVKEVGGRKIIIQDAKWSDVVIHPPDIVVFPHKDSAFPKAIIEKLKHKPSLVVAHGDGLAAAGATINFYLDDGKMRFELNLKAAEDNQLKVSPTLVKLGKAVK